MAWLHSLQNGKPQWFEQDQVQPALESGQFGMPPGQVPMIGHSGDRTTADATTLLDAYKKGYRLQEPEDDYGSFKHQAAAAGLGLLQGYTYGFGEAALAKFGPWSARELSLIERANPGTKLTAEVAAAIASAVSGPGAFAATGKLATKALGKKAAKEATEATISSIVPESAAVVSDIVAHGAPSLAVKALAQTGKDALRGAVGAGVYGVGQALTENQLGDPATVSEALLYKIGPQALMGGALGGAIGGISVLAGEYSKNLADKAARKFVDAATERAPALEKRAIAQTFNISMNKVDDISNELLRRETKMAAEAGLPAPTKADAFNVLFDERAMVPVEGGGAIFEPGLSKLDVRNRLKASVEYHAANIGNIYEDAAKQFPQAGPSIDAITKRLQPFLKEFAEPSGQQVGKVSLYDSAVREINEFARRLEGQPMSFQDAHRLAVNFGQAGYVQGDKTLSAARRAIERATKLETMDALAAVAPDAAKQLARHDKYYSRLVRLSRAAKDEESLSGVAQVAKQFLAGLTWRAAVGYSAMGAAKWAAATTMGKQLHTTMRQAFKPASVAYYAHKASRMELIMAAMQETEKKVDKAVGGFTKALRTGAFVYGKVGAKGQDPRKEARDRSRQLASVLMDREAFANKATALTLGLEEHAPQTALAFTQKYGQLIQDLHRESLTIAEKTYNPLQPQLDDANWLPSHDKAAKFNRIFDAAMRPQNVLDRLQDGSLMNEEVSVFKRHYPSLYEKITMKMLTQISDLKEPLSFRSRQALSRWLQQPLDVRANAGFTQRAQQVYSSGQSAQSGGEADLRGVPEAFRTRSQQIANP